MVEKVYKIVLLLLCTVVHFLNMWHTIFKLYLLFGYKSLFKTYRHKHTNKDNHFFTVIVKKGKP